MVKEQTFEVRDYRNKEMFLVDDAYMNGWAAKCGPFASMVYFALCRHADKKQTCFPSHSHIAKKVGISTRQVVRAIHVLEAHNIITTTHTLGGHNFYTLVTKQHWIANDTHVTGANNVTSDCESLVTNSHDTSDCESPPPVTNSHSKDLSTEGLGIKACPASPDAPKKEPKAACKKPREHPPYQRIWFEKYREAQGRDFIVTNWEVFGAQFKKLREVVPEIKVFDGAVARYFADSYWRDKDFPIEGFIKQINKFIKPVSSFYDGFERLGKKPITVSPCPPELRDKVLKDKP